MTDGGPAFDVVAEIDVPHRPDLDPVRRQIDALAPLTRRVLVPDSPTGRPAVSGLAVAAVALDAGAEVTAVLNARDRNTAGLTRDLLGCSPSASTTSCCCAATAPRMPTRTGRSA